MKRIFFTLLFFTLLLSAFCIGANAQIFEGRAFDEDAVFDSEGEGDAFDDSENVEEAYELAAYYRIQYRLDTETGVLRIFCGETKPQKMLPYARGAWIPWLKDEMRPYIRTVIIEEGVLTVGRYSFWNCENLETVYLPHSIYRVDRTVFYECPKLREIYYAGTEEDFEDYVLFETVRNSYTSPSGKVTEARDLFKFGESVTVLCENQDGEIFDAYTVGGFAAGDAYSITPKTYDGVSYVGKKSLYEGKFKKNDSSNIVMQYECDHEYAMIDDSLLCSSACIYCGCGDPEYADEHTWKVTRDVESSLIATRQVDKECTVCGVKYLVVGGIAPIWFIGAGVAILVIVAAVVCLILIPIRKKRKEKELSW